MSQPDQIWLLGAEHVPPKIHGYPHRLALLPGQLTLEQLGGPEARTAGVFAVDADCAHLTLNDASLDEYLRAKVPVLICTQRARDLRPFKRRADKFRARGYRIEVLP